MTGGGYSCTSCLHHWSDHDVDDQQEPDHVTACLVSKCPCVGFSSGDPDVNRRRAEETAALAKRWRAERPAGGHYHSRRQP